MKSIANGMANERYAPNASSGFILDEQSLGLIRGKYVQRIEFTERITDPFGKQFEYPIVHFLQQEFLITADPSSLLLLNTCPAAKALTGRLAEFSDFTISVEPIALDTNAVIKRFTGRFQAVRINAASVDDLPISVDTIVRLHFQSSGNLRQRAREFLEHRRFKFSHLNFSFEFSGQDRRCEIKSSGMICIHGEYDPSLQSAVLEIIRPLLTRNV
jgi:hypothetical protein